MFCCSEDLIRQLVQGRQRFTTSLQIDILEISWLALYMILTEHLQYRKCHTFQVPKMLTGNIKILQMASTLTFLLWQKNREKFWNTIITIGEIWALTTKKPNIYHYREITRIPQTNPKSLNKHSATKACSCSVETTKAFCSFNLSHKKKLNLCLLDHGP